MAYAKDAVLIRERIYIPVHLISVQDVQDEYTTKRYDEKSCKKCEYISDRFSYLCEECPSYLGEIRLFAKKTIKGRSYLGIPVGDKKNFERKTGLVFEEMQFKDLRHYAPFDYKIKFLAKLRDYQEPVIADFLKKKYGLIEAPPRTGKCVVGDTYVHTERGMVRIDSMFEKDHGDKECRKHQVRITSRNGVDRTSHTYKERVAKTIKISTAFGFEARGTFDHPMLVLAENLSLIWKKLSDIVIGDTLCVQRNAALFSSCVPTIPEIPLSSSNARPQKYPRTLTLALAKLLGYFTANGNLGHCGSGGTTFSFCTENAKVQRDFAQCLQDTFGLAVSFRSSAGRTPSASVNSSHIRDILAAYGLSLTKAAGKKIPWSILQAPKEFITAYLSAYFSCDSWLPNRATDAIELCSASRVLIKQLHILLLQYGIVGKRTKGISWARNSRTQTKRMYYHIHLLSTEKNLFYKEFKLLKERGSISGRSAADHDRIPNLGYWLSRLHAKRYVRVGVYTSIDGSEVTSRSFGKLIEDHSKSPSELPDNLNYRVAKKINTQLLEELSPTFNSKLNDLLVAGYFFDPVRTKTVLEKPVTVYDVTVPRSHSFIANGLVSHNTLISLYIGLQLGQKMLLLANQHEFVEQFLDHVHGNEEEGIPKCTNLPELEDKYGKKLYGTPKTDEDFENFQIFAMTYQAFMSEKNGKDRFKKINGKIGTVGVDEVHKSAAEGFSRVMQMFRTRYRFGVSATIDRKDGLQFVVKNILGPVVARSTREALTPTAILIPTEVKGKSFGTGKGAWVRAMQYLSKDKKRNALIVDWVMKDLKKGHNIVIPVAFKNHVMLLRDLINERFGSDICETFVGGGGKKNKLERKAILARAKAGKTRVIVGIRSLLQLGLNVPQWSCIYTVIPISNEPNYKQETKRICTPLEDKRPPIIRLFYDANIGQSLGCARNCVRQMRKFKYAFKSGEKQELRMQEVMGGAREEDPLANDDDKQFHSTKSLFDKSGTVKKKPMPKRI